MAPLKPKSTADGSLRKARASWRILRSPGIKKALHLKAETVYSLSFEKGKTAARELLSTTHAKQRDSMLKHIKNVLRSANLVRFKKNQRRKVVNKLDDEWKTAEEKVSTHWKRLFYFEQAALKRLHWEVGKILGVEKSDLKKERKNAIKQLRDHFKILQPPYNELMEGCEEGLTYLKRTGQHLKGKTADADLKKAILRQQKQELKELVHDQKVQRKFQKQLAHLENLTRLKIIKDVKSERKRSN